MVRLLPRQCIAHRCPRASSCIAQFCCNEQRLSAPLTMIGTELIIVSSILFPFDSLLVQIIQRLRIEVCFIIVHINHNYEAVVIYVMPRRQLGLISESHGTLSALTFSLKQRARFMTFHLTCDISRRSIIFRDYIIRVTLLCRNLFSTPRKQHANKIYYPSVLYR